jgi:type VI secretion system ImpM family protein
MASFPPPTQQASLFGKLPTVLDYVRINHNYPPAIALDEWMSRALQDLTVASLSWPSARYRFVFAPSGMEHALVGVFGPSRDRAGRKFPLSVFVPVPVGAIAHKFAALPAACQELFSAADALLDDAAKLSRDDAAERLLSVPRLDLDVLEDEYAALQVALDERSADSFVHALYTGADYAAEDAFARATAALSKVQSAAPERALALDCPVASISDVSAWLSLVEACLRWEGREAPSAFWSTDADPGRLLISLGTPLPLLPLWLADRKRKSDRLVSLVPPPGTYAAPAAHAAPASEYTDAAPASDAAYATPASGSAYATPASGSAYATPAPAPSAPLPTPARAPLPMPGASTPPQGFSITARLPDEASSTWTSESTESSSATGEAGLDEVDADAAYDDDAQDAPTAAAAEPESQLGATPPADPAAHAEDAEDGVQSGARTSARVTAKTGPSLWRKWRALAGGT